jgi:hypothetical protein
MAYHFVVLYYNLWIIHSRCILGQLRIIVLYDNLIVVVLNYKKNKLTFGTTF